MSPQLQATEGCLTVEWAHEDLDLSMRVWRVCCQALALPSAYLQLPTSAPAATTTTTQVRVRSAFDIALK